MNRFLKGVFFCCVLLSLSAYAEEDAMQILDRMRVRIEKEEAEKAKLAVEARELGVSPSEIASMDNVEELLEAKRAEEASAEQQQVEQNAAPTEAQAEPETKVEEAK